MFVLGIELANANEFRGIGIRWARIRKLALADVAKEWHRTVLHRHFTPHNRSRYRLAQRREIYMKKIKVMKGQGQGKFVELLLSGKSERWLKVFHAISSTGNMATLRMKPPSYFTNPFIGSFTDKKTGKRKTVRRQPDKPDETTQVNDPDRATLREYMQERMQFYVSFQLLTGAAW